MNSRIKVVYVMNAMPLAIAARLSLTGVTLFFMQHGSSAAARARRATPGRGMGGWVLESVVRLGGGARVGRRARGALAALPSAAVSHAAPVR